MNICTSRKRYGKEIELFSIVFSEHTLNAGLGLATPLLLCALGGAVCSKAGNFNIALEGFMLIGSFFGVVGSYYFKNAAVGLLLAVSAATAASMLYGLFLICFKAHEIILGFGFNMFAVAITGWLLGPMFGGKGSFYDPATPSLAKINIKFLETIPVLRVLSGHNMVVYLSWLLIPLLYLLMYKTALGYRLRALGENPDAIIASGLSTAKYSFFAELMVGLLCGMAGAFLSIGNLSMFTENMTSGRGFISVAAVGLSNAYIPLTAAAGITFGIANAMAIQLQGLGMPTQFVDMIPYVFTTLILLLAVFKNGKLRTVKGRG
jgi:simple sugar transport system permease protein